MNSLTFNLDAALSVEQINQGSTRATRTKLYQLVCYQQVTLEIVNLNKIQVIATQETKLKKMAALKIKGYNIFRANRPSRGGGGLAFFIRDVKYQSIDFSQDQSSDLEIQGFKIFWRGKPLHIFNVYLSSNQSHLPTNFSNFTDKNTIILGYLNAKHNIWRSSCNNDRGEDILQMMDDKEFMILNDGSPTHSSFICNTFEALDTSITRADIFSQCT
ncbi:RNA-directed DNA polymerase from mobile element jockey [Nephila pilipes]|uniref:RNA-directed DNA polymerase from mobile element jockey n=1 Tax=Nephila pilipes TaxID=299642 RepID=A0A8X6US10_NEPPI|nr:RNA-directed DNA polymerase from mobile element jockey [Nephila pilipes]